MMSRRRIAAAMMLLCAVYIGTPVRSAPPTTKFVEVQKGVRLEVLDMGGTGQPLIFLAGFGGTAHTFGDFARHFTSRHHVYAITRRGFGASSKPPPTPENYTPERLAADVMSVIEHLNIRRPVIAGHSVAGQELSEIGSRYPSRIAGLIYLDAANPQAYYGPRSDAFYPIAGQVRRDLARVVSVQPSEAKALVQKLRSELPRLEAGLQRYDRAVHGAPDQPVAIVKSPQFAIQTAILLGAKVHGPIDVPILAIFALPEQCAPDCDSPEARIMAKQDEVQADDFAAGHPAAVIVRLPYADHFVWRSNERDVEHAMDGFLDKLSSVR